MYILDEIVHNFLKILFLSQLGLGLVSGIRTKYNFNSDWKLFIGDVVNAETPSFDDGSWKHVTLPHAWNEDEAFRVNIQNLSTGIAWYRKHFKLPSVADVNKIFLEFEGIRHGGQFYLNGEPIGRNENGVMAFGFDVTSYIKRGEENVLAARIDNSWEYRELDTNQRYQWNDRNFYANYGGINKNVQLHVTPKLYQTLPLYSNLGTIGVYVYAKDIEIDKRSATIVAETQVRNEESTAQVVVLEIAILEVNGHLVQRFQSGKYTLQPNETSIISASVNVSSLQFWSWGYGYLYDISTTLQVDGKAIDIVTTRTGFRKTAFANGTFWLNDHALHLKGYAQRSTNEWVALGSSVPAWLSDFSNKLVSGSNGNLIRWMHVTPWKQDVESLDRLGIMQSMPAGDSESDVSGRRWEQRLELMRDAIIYNRNNPSIVFYESGNKGISEQHMSEMKKLRDVYDPHGGRAAGSREMLNSTVAEFGGEMLYINKGAKYPLWQMEYSRDEGLRKYWDELSPPYHPDGEGPLYNGEDASSYNRNQDSHAIENVQRWFDYYEMRPGTGERVNAGGVNIIFSDSQTHFRGAENYRRSGEVDAVRLPKDGWFAHQVMWNTWVDANEPASHIIGHWDYEPGTLKNVSVISTTEKVQLLINGEHRGWGTRSHNFLFSFPNITYEPGRVEAIGYTANNQRVSFSTRVTSGEPAAIRLSPHTSPMGFVANGADVAIIDVEVIDSKGQRCPTALNTINFTLTGAAEWRGGIAQGPDNYILSKELPVENGINRVILRSTRTSGKVHLLATSYALNSAEISIFTLHFNASDGLSIQFPSAGLSSDLSRGPTPEGDGLIMKRRSLRIQSVKSGSNSSIANLSFDDNETTQWTSSGDTSTSWITYIVQKPSLINQVVMKLSGFRTKQYSLKIIIDDKIAWEGKTPTSLGYVTLSFDEIVGQSVTIASTSGLLSIIEAEIYAPIAKATFLN
ncbi:beta-galactosidase [Bisporella sp. PMI_857]|nr:beta-galactosidase [Bisporella sp. PMI_857]